MNTMPCSAFLQAALPGLMLLAPVATCGEYSIDSSFANDGFMDYPAGYEGLVGLPGSRLQLTALGAGSLRVLRFDADGRPDATFGVSGFLETPMSTGSTRVLSSLAKDDGSTYLTLLTEGNTVLTPARDLITQHEARLMRLTPAGRPDYGFGPEGIRSFPFQVEPGANISGIADVAVAPGGSLYVLVNYLYEYYDCTLAQSLFKLLPDGRADAAFGIDGQVRLPKSFPCATDWSQVLALGADRVLLSSGSVMSLLDSRGEALSIPRALQDSGQVPIAAVRPFLYTASIPVPSGLAVDIRRWLSDLEPDPSFGVSGSLLVPIDLGSPGLVPINVEGVKVHARSESDPYLHFMMEVMAQPANSRYDSQEFYFPLLIRLLADGELDRGFGNGGVMPIRSFTSLVPVQQQAGGGLVAATARRGAIRLTTEGQGSPGMMDIALSCQLQTILSERGIAASIPVRRTLGSSGALAVDFQTRAITATPGVDYRETSGTLRWEDGETGDRFIPLEIIDDSLVEPVDEEFQIVLSPSSGAPILPCTSARIGIYSDDSATGPPAGPSANPANQEPAPASVSGGGGGVDPMLLGLLGFLLRKKFRREGLSSPRRGRASAWGWVVGILIGFSGTVLAGSGVVDPTFGKAGRLELPAGFGELVPLPDGGLQAFAYANGILRILRMDADGHPQADFGTAGLRQTDIPAGTGYLSAAWPMPGGSTLVSLALGYKLILVAVGPDGLPDPDFGSNGLLSVEFANPQSFPGAELRIGSLALAEDGGFYLQLDVMSGYFYQCSYRAFIRRFNRDGSDRPEFLGRPEFQLHQQPANTCLEDSVPPRIRSLPGNRLLVIGGIGGFLLADGANAMAPQAWLDRISLGFTDLLDAADRFVYTSRFEGAALILRRWTPDLLPDRSFGPSGDGSIDLNLALPATRGFTMQEVHLMRATVPDAPLYVSAMAYAPDPYGDGWLLGSVLSRIRPDGASDPTFGRDGSRWLGPPGAIRPDGIQQRPGALLFAASGVNVTYLRVLGEAESAAGLISPGEHLCSGGRVEENAGRFVIPVHRTLGSRGTVSVRYSTTGRSATAGSDFVATSGVLTWADGEEGEKPITLQILEDGAGEPDEDLEVALVPESGDPVMLCEVGRLVIGASNRAPSGTPPGPVQPGPVQSNDSGGGGSMDLVTLGVFSLPLMALVRRRRLWRAWSTAGLATGTTAWRAPARAGAVPLHPGIPGAECGRTHRSARCPRQWLRRRAFRPCPSARCHVPRIPAGSTHRVRRARNPARGSS